MGFTTTFLPSRSQHWVSGPMVPTDMVNPCSIEISERSFLAIQYANILEYQVDPANPTSDDGWQDATKWPQLRTSRGSWPGCAKVSSEKVVIAGGQGLSGSSLRSAEILDLSTRKIQATYDLRDARRHFHILTIRTNGIERAFALGGKQDDSTWLDSVEEFDPENLTWRVAKAKLAKTRSFFGAVALPRSIVCQT